MKVERNKVVSLIYELRESDSAGRIIEALDENRPLTFIFGTGHLLPVFESNISSLSNGDNFSFQLNSKDAYGERQEDMIIDVPKSVFQVDGKIDENICCVGNEVPLVDNEGHPLNGIISEISDDFVKMDFNHPMAGIDLFFTGKITGVRDATEEELNPSSCSCSSCGCDHESSCGGSCGE